MQNFVLEHSWIFFSNTFWLSRELGCAPSWGGDGVVRILWLVGLVTAVGLFALAAEAYYRATRAHQATFLKGYDRPWAPASVGVGLLALSWLILLGLALLGWCAPLLK